MDVSIGGATVVVVVVVEDVVVVGGGGGGGGGGSGCGRKSERVPSNVDLSVVESYLMTWTVPLPVIVAPDSAACRTSGSRQSVLAEHVVPPTDALEPTSDTYDNGSVSYVDVTVYVPGSATVSEAGLGPEPLIVAMGDCKHGFLG